MINFRILISESLKDTIDINPITRRAALLKHNMLNVATHDPDYLVRSTAAVHGDKAHHEILKDDPVASVRFLVARNTHHPDILQHIAKYDSDIGMRELAKKELQNRFKTVLEQEYHKDMSDPDYSVRSPAIIKYKSVREAAQYQIRNHLK